MRDDGGGEAAFRAFVAARRPALLRTAWLLTGNREDAEDLVQTALAGLAKHWDRVGPEGQPEAYARRAITNAHISRWRRTRNVREVPEADAEPPGPPTADPARGVDDRLVLAGALARLTPKQRAVLVLRFYEDLSEAQTAEALGVSVGTVKSQTRHALDRLRALAPELAAFAPAGRQEVTR